MAFAIVKFLKGNQVSVVPINWLAEDFCFWPPEKLGAKLMPLVQKGVKVSPADTWERYQVTVLDVFETYIEARAKIRVAEDTSDLNTTDIEDCGRGKRARSGKRRCSSSSEEEEFMMEDPPSFEPKETLKKQKISFKVQDESSPLFTEDLPYQSESLLGNDWRNFSKTPKNSVQDESSPLFTEDVPVESESLLGNRSNNTPSFIPKKKSPMVVSLHNRADSMPSTSADQHISIPEAGYKKLLREVNILKHNQQQIIEMLAILLKRTETVKSEEENCSEEIKSIINIIPIKTEEDLAEVEERLSQEGIMLALIQYLKGIGGGNLDQIIRFILRRLIDDRMASMYSFLGQREKKSFKQLNLYKVVIGAVRQHETVKEAFEADINKSICSWLKHAKARYTKKIVL